MKKKFVLLIGIIVFFIILFFAFTRTGFDLKGEDFWIKDSRGVWVMHGNPSETPDYVFEQQEIITCALDKFNNFSDEKNSQCLGTCENYAVDIVHVPRSSEDDLKENQCEDYVDGRVSNFIELDENGNIVRIV